MVVVCVTFYETAVLFHVPTSNEQVYLWHQILTNTCYHQYVSLCPFEQVLLAISHQGFKGCLIPGVKGKSGCRE